MQRRNLITLRHKIGKPCNKYNLNRFVFPADPLGELYPVYGGHLDIQQQDVVILVRRIIEQEPLRRAERTDIRVYVRLLCPFLDGGGDILRVLLHIVTDCYFVRHLLFASRPILIRLPAEE